jgi:hypothetical protein
MPTTWYSDYVGNNDYNNTQSSYEDVDPLVKNNEATGGKLKIFYLSMLVWSIVSIVVSSGLLIVATDCDSTNKSTFLVVLAALLIVVSVVIVIISSMALYYKMGYVDLYQKFKYNNRSSDALFAQNDEDNLKRRILEKEKKLNIQSESTLESNPYDKLV